MGTGDPIPICKTEVRKDDLNPTWRPLFFNIQQVKSKDNPLIIDCFNFINTGKYYLIGTVQKSLADLEYAHNSQHGENLFLPTLVGQNIDNKVLLGQLFVDKYSETLQNTFLDYIASGWELNFMVAIDFTGVHVYIILLVYIYSSFNIDEQTLFDIDSYYHIWTFLVY